MDEAQTRAQLVAKMRELEGEFERERLGARLTGRRWGSREERRFVLQRLAALELSLDWLLTARR